MVIIGINAFHADASAAIYVDGKLIAAIEEERFSRIKHQAGFPFKAIDFCLQTAGLRYRDVDYFAIGRDPDAEIFLNSPSVSRQHARITISAGRATIDDLGSKNGTFAGNQRVVGPTSIGDGDVIVVGSVELILRVVQAPSSTKTEAGERHLG